MADPIYLIPDGSSGGAMKLEARAYDKEEEFQDLLRRFPELLAGEQVDREDPRRWLLVAREAGIPDDEASAGRWSLDHLFLDQDRIPTLVEVKRQSDTRLRREVVGQMLDYAANAVRHWPAPLLAEAFDQTCRKAGQDAVKTLREFFKDPGLDPSELWSSVEANLRNGDMRLVFFADAIPRELRMIVEFLNSQMTRTEVLAVEVRRYSGHGYSTHIPQLFGQTSEAEAAKASSKPGARRKWNAELFFDACAALPAETRNALRLIRSLSDEEGFSIKWGTGQLTGSMNLIIPGICHRSVMSFFTDGILMLNFGWLPDEARGELANLARSALDLSLDAGWEKEWVRVPHPTWTPRVKGIVTMLEAVRDRLGE